MKFAVIGDMQNTEFGGRGNLLNRLMESVNTHGVDYVLFPGDLVGDTGNAGWAEWATRTSVLGQNDLGRDKRLMTPGNHDRGQNDTFGNWQNTFNWLPDSQVMNGQKGIDQVDYFVDHGSVRFISISTDAPGQYYNNRAVNNAPPALAWMQQVMKDVDARNSDADPNNNIDHVFTFSHRPVSTQIESPTGGTNGAWWESMTGQAGSASGQKAATAFLPGHWHMYQPSRPDPDVDTAEIISGTGGGGLEGQAHRNRHGFSIVTVDGGDVTSEFYGDFDQGNSDTWDFQLLDTFVIAKAGGLPKGELARYEFENGSSDQDTSVSALSKGHQLNFNSGATTQTGALNPNGGYVDAKNIGDNNLAVLGDLSLQFDLKSNNSPGSNEVIAIFGGAHGSANGSLNSQESANVIYELSLTPDNRLRMNWQHDDGTWVGEILSDVLTDPRQWHRYTVVRDADTKTVTFFVDGQQLGSAVPFSVLPTGGGSGSLYLGGNIGGGASFDGLIDNVVISSTVPEPASLALMALGGLLVPRRLRR